VGSGFDHRDPYDDGSLSEPLSGADAASAAEGADGPAVGRDEWVARHGERRTARSGRLGAMEARARDVPWWAWLTLFVAFVALLPTVFEDGYTRRVAFDIVLYMMLALGLNIVVGWGGLLDLGYVAFYGVGAYTYAMLSSGQFDLHLPTIVTIFVAMVAGALAGLLVGLPSWRLSGDYLAIVTLFFFQIFNTVITNGDNINGTDVTGGSNGIANLDPVSIFGRDIAVAKEGVFNVAYLYVALALFTVVFVLLWLLNTSRTGRAWRSLREDALAAEVMGMPVNWLKLMAFSFGAATAALTGTLFAALNGGVFPQTFAFPLLITIYTMVILGGAGSMAGVALGAIIVGVLLELLREPADSRYFFYFAVVLGLFAAFRLSLKLVVVVGGTLALGVVVRLLAEAQSDDWAGKAGEEAGWLGELVARWVLVPADAAAWVTPVTYISLVALTLVLTLVRGWWRIGLLVPTLYLAAFVWENVMGPKPSSTRFVVLGAVLVATMIMRPNGILGEKRVEIV
jgi:branched-chain amino acid transport system permease protein